MAAVFLLVGLASDGPSNVPYRPKDLRDLKMWFGGDYRERFYLSASATAVTLQYPPTKLPLNEVDGRKQYLFSPVFDTTNRNVINFGNIGFTNSVYFGEVPRINTTDFRHTCLLSINTKWIKKIKK